MVELSGIYTLLNTAATGQVTALKGMVCGDCSIDFTDITGKNALWLAIERGNTVAVETLLKAGADVNKTCNYRRTPLMLAAEKGHPDYLHIMLEAGAEIDSVDSYGMSSLMIASQKGHLDSLQMLVKAGASLHIEDIRGKTALMIAVEESSCECLQYLIEAGSDIHHRDFKGSSPMMTAVYKNCEKCLQTLVEAGISINEIDVSGKTCLMIAAERESNILSVIVQMGANLDQTDSRYRTSVMQAASAGRINSLRLLVQANAALDLTDECAQTALMLAADAGHNECIECLVNGGARLDLPDAKGRTALMIAASRGQHACLPALLQGEATWIDLQCKSGKTALVYALEAVNEDSVLQLTLSVANMKAENASGRRGLINLINNYQSDGARKCLKVLLDSGANLDICDKNDMSPLMYGAKLDMSAKFLQHLLDAGANIDVADKYRKTALAHAACQGNFEYVRKLVEAGALVNTVSSTGETPLLHMVRRQSSFSLCSTISYLLDNNADPNIPDYVGTTPLMLAAKSTAAINIMSLLISHGAKIDMADKIGYCALHHTLDCNSNVDFLTNAKYLLDRGANPNLRTAKGKSLMSLVIQKRNVAFLTLLLKYNVDPLMEWEDFSYLVTFRQKKMLQLLILHCVMPSPFQSLSKDRVSFLVAALNVGSLAVAKFFLAVGYLNNSDIICWRPSFRKARANLLRQHWVKPNPESTSFIESVYSQPWPLVKLCFVTVSSNIGTGPGRKDRVRQSGLPDRLQRMLMFQDPISKLCENHWDSIPFCFDPNDYENLPKPRPLLFYWPFGRDLYPCDCSVCVQQGGFRFL